MRKGKTEKGITLIALILTIVILLILAIVAINSITNDGLLGKTEDITNNYNQSVKNEQKVINGYEGFLGNYINRFSSKNTWTQDGVRVTNGKVTLEVGQTVTGYTGYSESYEGGWAVLGAENGKLLLVSKEYVKDHVILGGKEGGTINGKECAAGYYNGIAKLNEFCEPYLNSSLADEVRSINVEDINRITKYNPEKTGDGEVYGKGLPWQYGNKVTYSLNSEGYVVYESVAYSGKTNFKSFVNVNGDVLGTVRSRNYRNNK